MNEIDITKCGYYNDYYKTCSNFSKFGGDEPYCDPKEFKCSYYVNNIEKQLQQAKADVEKAKKYNYDAGQQLIRMSQEVQRLKQENESYEYQLEKRIEICDSWMNLSNKYKTALDEIEGIAKNGVKDDCGMPLDELSIILQLIKQAKEGGE